MNKTLLLIICDFLLLNLLALTRYERTEPTDKGKAPVPIVAGNTGGGKSANDDIVETMRVALADEQASREKLAQQMAADVQKRDAALTELQKQRQALEASLLETEKKAETITQRLQETAQQAVQVQEKLQLTEQQQKELAESVRASADEKRQLLENLRLQQLENERKAAELERQRQATIAIEKEKREAEKQVASLNTAVQVAETVKSQLQKNVTELKEEVTTVQQEKVKLQEQTTTLATGVTQLAAKSGELSREVREIRENVPINANLIFNDFLSNRVTVAVSLISQTVFGSNQKQKETPSVLVADGGRIFAVFHIRETPLTLSNPALGGDKPTVRIAVEGAELRHGNIQVTLTDPRILTVSVQRVSADALGLKIYPLSRNPFKFTEAVLVSRSGKYGEIEFKLDPKLPDFVRMKNRVLSRMFGDFSPNAGDLVLSKTGEVLGIMVNDDFCAVLRTLAPRPGYDFDPGMSRDTVAAKLNGLYDMVERLPMALR